MQAINTGDTAFMLISTALVMFMTPGLALFYGGMVRGKNVLSVLMYSFFAIAVVTVLWVLVGFTLAFGPDKAGLIGGLKWLGLSGVGQAPNTDYAPTIPAVVFMMYQGMFAVITPALITGAFVERIKFSAYVVFTAAWSLLVYAPLAHWVWGLGGWLRNLGALDFAGGAVIHASAGAAGLAAAIVVGRRRGYSVELMHPHNIPMTLTGGAILWFGYFGFNAGSALTAGGLAGMAFICTHISAAAASIGWVLAERFKSGKPTTLGGITGAVAGLVAVTPAAGFISPMSALVLGFVAGIICFWAVTLKWRFGYDDSLDVFGIHLVAGTLGMLALGLLAQKSLNGAGNNGLFFGNASLLGTQLLTVGTAIAYSFLMTILILKVVEAVTGLRVTDEEENAGLDLSHHGEAAYALHD